MVTVCFIESATTLSKLFSKTMFDICTLSSADQAVYKYCARDFVDGNFNNFYLILQGLPRNMPFIVCISGTWSQTIRVKTETLKLLF